MSRWKGRRLRDAAGPLDVGAGWARAGLEGARCRRGGGTRGTDVVREDDSNAGKEVWVYGMGWRRRVAGACIGAGSGGARAGSGVLRGYAGRGRVWYECGSGGGRRCGSWRAAAHWHPAVLWCALRRGGVSAAVRGTTATAGRLAASCLAMSSVEPSYAVPRGSAAHSGIAGWSGLRSVPVAPNWWGRSSWS
eukprot:s608_g5.t1